MITRAGDDLQDFLHTGRRDVDAHLARYLAALSTPPVLREAMSYSLLSGGKRLRSLLVLAAADAVGGSDARALALPAACAVEMLHTYSLIHDDLPAMDDDTLRRGRPTLHVVAGDGMAILAGDGLQAAAFGLLADEPVTDDPSLVVRKLRVLRMFTHAAGPAGMVGGQALDLDAGRHHGTSPAPVLAAEDLRSMHAMKTGALIRASAMAGAVLAGADERLVDAVCGYGEQVGLAFQIVDDVLDVEAATATLGKTAGKDAASGKPTYAALHGIAGSRALAATCLQRAAEHLTGAGLAESRLLGIAEWVVSRQS